MEDGRQETFGKVKCRDSLPGQATAGSPLRFPPCQFTPCHCTPHNLVTPMQPLLPARSEAAHKGDFGKVLVIGGSESMPGAAALSGLAALRCGAGLVTIATSREAHPITAGFSPALMTAPLPSLEGRIATTQEFVRPLLDRADCVALGPGLGQSRELQALVSDLYREFAGPMIVDADGLNNLANRRVDWGIHAGPRILTPHLGEFRRMLDISPASPLQHPRDSSESLRKANDFAGNNGVLLLVKGPATLTTDGTRVHFNATGNSGLATAGSGDVLTGMLAALWAAWRAARSCRAGEGDGTASCRDSSSDDAWNTAVTAVHLHGLAGDLAAEALSETSLISSDLLDFIGPAIRRLGGS